ncbi:Acetyl LDL receptor [Macaca mulatta]|uniref:Acetyl LDL receptor n=1 Tax=Macaca mulatta TaxID=9544 RepID=G7NHL9_MACMU|nr:Acetyl LDL receptor [Macaca mulatta]
MGLGLLLPLLLLWTRGTQGSELDPNGQHVCVASSPSAELQCCAGWRQKDQECTIPICEGPDACQKDEVCVKPGLCRCKPGFFGAYCSSSCGHCKHNEPCSPDTGSCESCEPGWNGTQCQQPCLPGTFGESCGQQCSHCRRGEVCQPDTGHCQRCDPGWLGPRCEDPCLTGTFGEDCGSTCPTCVQGACDAVTGECVCSAGYWGPSCNTSCPAGFHGNNCSVPCECPEGPCHPVSGSCQSLVPLLLLFLGLACCACCCWATRSDLKDRPARDRATVSRMKMQVWGTLTSLGSTLPCGSLSSHKLPWVTVSHHDPEVPFNHSFIEPPSAGWASDDSFSSDPESAEADEVPAYCVPPHEGMVPVAQAESSEASLAGGAFPPPEDASTPFAIPRTSSLARAKRPSVSFAEGTKFAPQSRRGSGELSSPLRKPKRLSRGAQSGPEGREAEESTGLEEAETDEALPAAASPGDSATGHRRPPLGGRTVAEHVEAIEGSVQESSGPVTTVYMLVGTPRGSEGPVRSVLRHFGGFQKGQAEPKVKRAIPKPPRQALNRKKGSPGLASGSVSQSPNSAPKAGLPGATGPMAVRPEEVARGLGAGTESSGRAQEPISGAGFPKQDPQKQAEEERQEEPEYENVVPISRPPEP